MVDTIKAMVSSPIDGATNDEIKNLIKSVLGTFTTSYVKNYALALVKKGIDDAAQAPGPNFKLETRPPRDWPWKEGWVMKEAGHFKKSLEKRYFVVRPDYFIDYYDSEANFAKGKKKNTISLCGYSVNDDANNGMIQRLFKLAEKMGVDTSSLPKPKEYPKNTMELYHSRRETYYIQVEDDEEFKQWLSQMRTCCWHAQGYKDKDPVHIVAFEAAIRQTRYKLGRWGWWSYGGTEEQILSDLIADELDWTVMGRIYGKITGSWTLRYMIRNQVLKAIDKLVLAGVKPAWAAMEAAVKKIRPEIEPKINELVAPIGKAKLELMTKIQDACMSVITPILKEHVVPHLSKIVEVIQSPMTEAFEDSYPLYQNEVFTKFEIKGSVDDNRKAFRELDWFPYSYKMYNITRKIDVMYEPLWALHIIFEDIYPWSSIWTAHDVLRRTMDNAIYTYEKRLIEEQEKGGSDDLSSFSEKLRNQVLDDYKSDSNLTRVLYYADIIKKIVYPPFQKLVIPAAEKLLSPLDEAIPEPMKQFIDINDMFETLCSNIVNESINTVLSSSNR